MSDLVKRLRNLSVCEPGCNGRCVECPADVVREAADLIERLEEALTPSRETKAAYIGEFSFRLREIDGDAPRVLVPWTTIKEIMTAIRARAALGGKDD